MAGVNDKGLRRLGPWPLGIDNLAKEGALPTDEDGHPVALREADNVDLDRSGYPTRRPGRERFYDGTLTHSLWGHPDLPFAIFVDAGELHAVFPDQTVQPLGQQVGDQPVSYELINDRVYFTNATTCGMVTLDLQVWPWAPEHPAGQPDLDAVAGFGLGAGQYQVAITFVDGLGRESGCTLAAAIELPDARGLALSNIPQPTEASTLWIAVYCTGPNDQVLRLAATIAPGSTSYVIAQQANGRSLTTQFLAPLPPGQIVRLANGRQYVLRGRELLWSEPLRYGMFNPLRNRVRFAKHGDLLEPAGKEGIFVATGARTVWLAGVDPATFAPRTVRSSGAVPGSGMRVPGNVLGLETAEELPVWLARSGHFCVGMPSGSVLVLKDGQAVIDDADRAAVLFRQKDGLQQVIAALRAPRAQGLAIRDLPVAHVIYDGSAG